MDPWALLLLTSIVGALLGCLTGLLPSLHVNTLSVLLLASAAPLAWAFTTVGAEPDSILFLTAGLILAITISHSFVNIIPGTYLGAPDESHALSVLPAHRLLLRGQGYRAVRLSAYASFAALLVSLALLLPTKWILARPVHAFRLLQDHVFLLLALAALWLVWNETKGLGPGHWSQERRRGLGRAAGLAVLLASGLYGLLLFRLPYDALLPVPPSPLLPALSGLFGAATVLEALTNRTRIPHQFLRLRGQPLAPRKAATGLLAGVAAGATISLLPGLTNASATSLAGAAKRGGDEEILVSLSAVNTANAVFNLLMLYLFLRTRSGAVVALEQLLPIEPWTHQAPPALLWLLFVALAAGAASLGLTLLIGRFFARRIHAVPYRKLLWAVFAYMGVVVAIFTGAHGLVVFATGAALGLVPVRLGLNRTHLTGVLLVPVLLYFNPWFQP